MTTLSAEAVDAVFETFGVAGRFTARGGGAVEVIVRRARGDDPHAELTAPGWAPTPKRQAQPMFVELRRSEFAGDPSGGVLEILEGADAGLYDVGVCTSRGQGAVWRLPLDPQAAS